ncbi:MAG: hypothetical protein QOC66_3702, partial [Pseudonocardiales bacterium]|nr:hypothetical protein [Pseudonocardiales bacterium]
VAAWAAAASLGTGLLTPWGVLDPAAPGPYDLPEVEPHVDVDDAPPCDLISMSHPQMLDVDCGTGATLSRASDAGRR